MMMEMMQKMFLEETGNIIGGYLNNAEKPLSGSDKKLQDSYEEFVYEATNPTGNTMSKLKNLALALCTVCLKFDHETEEDIDKLNEYQKDIILFTGKVVETLTTVSYTHLNGIVSYSSNKSFKQCILSSITFINTSELVFIK